MSDRPKWRAVEYWPTHSTGARQWIVRKGEGYHGCIHRGALAGKPIRFKTEVGAQKRAEKLNREDSDNG
jgi:hypothetical protein